MHFHELIVFTATIIPDGTTFCTANFARFSTYNRVNVLIHYIIPFCIQIMSTTVLIVLAALSRSRATSDQTTAAQVLKRQFKNHKELYITPVIIVLSAIPHSTLSFYLACNTLSAGWQRHALIISSFLSYSPQLLGFVLFVLPSSTYLNEFRETQFAKTCFSDWAISHKKNLARSGPIHNRTVICETAN